jgi:hypothetical protein
MTLCRALVTILVLLSGQAIRAEPTDKDATREALRQLIRGLPWEEHLEDAALITHFAATTGRFNLLLEMFMHDRGLRLIGRERSDPPDLRALGIDDRRLARYRQLLNELNVKFVHGRSDKMAGATFVVTARGLSISGSAKGYAWLPSAPSRITHDLDKYATNALAKREAARSKRERMAVTSYTVYRPLERNWYLFYSN